MKLLKNKLTVTIIVLSVTFLGIIFATVKREDVGTIESAAGSALNPVQKIVYNANRGVKDFVDFFLNYSDVKAENKSLAKENKQLQNELTELSDAEQELERLRALLDIKDTRTEYDYVGTNVIGYSGANALDGYIVDRGSDDGVKNGMVVIAAEGLVGQVSSVGTNWSIVQSIVNENIAVSVMPETTRENTGILKGYKDRNGENLAKVSYLPMESEVKEGDVILTAGLGGYYPKEIRVGEVLSVEVDKISVMKSAIIKPYVDFNKLEELMIIVPKEGREIKY